jgi:hypothetical protein
LKIGTFTDFLDLHLADSIPRVLAKIESAILAIALYHSLLLSITLNQEFNFGHSLNHSSILVKSLNCILNFGDGSGADFSNSLLLMLLKSSILVMLLIKSSIWQCSWSRAWFWWGLSITLYCSQLRVQFWLTLYHSLLLSIESSILAIISWFQQWPHGL